MTSFFRANTLNVVIIRRRYSKGAYSVDVVQWDGEHCAVRAGIFVHHSYVAIHDTRAELCSGDVGFA